MSQRRTEWNELRFFRRLLLAAGGFYLSWWFVVEWLLPGSFNPLGSRLFVVGAFLASFASTFVVAVSARRASWLFTACGCLTTAHYFYLFRGNHGAAAWVIGSYITVMAVSVCLRSRGAVLVYSVCVLVIGTAVCATDRALLRSIFLPGLATIVVFYSTGILHRIKLVDELEESTERFERLFNAIFEGVAVHDGGRIVSANDALASIFGVGRAELLGRALHEFVEAPSKDGVLAVEGRSDVPFEAVGVRGDGSRIAIEFAGKDYRYDDHDVRLVAVRDIRERKRAEHERIRLDRAQAAQVAAEAAVCLRDEFIALASHELRTPLTPLRLQIQTLQRLFRGPPTVPVPAERLEEGFANSLRHLDRLGRLVEELLDLSRLGRGRLALKPERLDLRALVREVVESQSREITASGCVVEVSGEGNATGTWDRMRIEQVVTNLLRNALIYGRAHPVDLTVEDRGGHVALRVRDRGIGIGEADRERVFKRFERAVSSEHYGGLGLGLYIVKVIVEAHHGSVRVESTLREGSTFVVDLPREVTPSNSRSSDTIAATW